MAQNKKKPVVEEIEVLDEVEIVEETVSDFVWMDPSPGLHDRLNILLRRRGITLEELITPEQTEGPEFFAKEIRLWAGFNGGSELTEEVWLKVLEKLER
jgi:hypothetical protein